MNFPPVTPNQQGPNGPINLLSKIPKSMAKRLENVLRTIGGLSLSIIKILGNILGRIGGHVQSDIIYKQFPKGQPEKTLSNTNTKITKQLIRIPRQRSAVNPEKTSSKAQKGISYALAQDDLRKCKPLIPFININATLENGETPLTFACWSKPTEIARLFAAHPDIDPNIPDKDGFTPLNIAIVTNNDKLIELLLAHSKVDPNIPGYGGKTPLQVSLRSTNDKITQKLLAHPKIEPNIPDQLGYTPLMTAILNHKAIAINQLLAHPKTDPNIGGEGRLLIQVVDSEDDKLLKLLLAHPKIDPNIRDKFGNLPLSNAIKNKSIEITKLLLTHPKIDPNIHIKFQDPPLKIAFNSNNDMILEFLLSNPKVDPNVFDSSGNTLLKIALQQKNEKLLKLLLAHPKIDPNLVDNYGNSSLKMILGVKNRDFLKLILAHPKVNLDKDGNGKAILGDALIKDDNEIIELLLMHPKFDFMWLIGLVKNDGQVESLLKYPKVRDAINNTSKATFVDSIVRLGIDNNPIHLKLVQLIDPQFNPDFLELIKLQNKINDLFKLITSRGIKITGFHPLPDDVRSFIKSIAPHNFLFNEINFALCSNPNIPLNQETVDRLVKIHLKMKASDPDMGKFIVALQGGASLSQIERASLLLNKKAPVTIEKWETLSPQDQFIWLNHCVVFKSRAGVPFAEKVLTDAAKKLQSDPPQEFDHRLTLAALRLIERTETTTHKRLEGDEKISDFENTISVMLLNGLTRLVHENNASPGDLKLLQQVFLTLSKIDTVHLKQRNLPALIGSLYSITEGMNNLEIQKLADPICGLLAAMRSYNRFDEKLKIQPEWIKMLLDFAAVADRAQPEKVRHKLLFELGLTLSLIPEPTILKKAYQIVQGKTWDHLTTSEKDSLTPMMGDFDLILYRPTAHDLRENISRRILDTLVTTAHLEPLMLKEYQKYSASPQSYPEVQQYHEMLLKTPQFGMRYMDPLYLPSTDAPVFRGINARKGEGLLDEALFDLLKRGAGSADLTNVASQSGTWAKIGHIFSSLTSNYVMGSYFADGGALMTIKPEWINEQIRIRQVRNAAEAGALHYVFYQTVPLEALSELLIPADLFQKVNALYSIPKFTKANLQNAGIDFPYDPDQQRDLFFLYQGIKEHGAELIPKLKQYEGIAEVRQNLPKEADFKNDVVPENVRRFIGRKIAKKWVNFAPKSKL